MKKPLAFIANWWQSAVEGDVVLKDYRCFKDLESSIQGKKSQYIYIM